MLGKIQITNRDAEFSLVCDAAAVFGSSNKRLMMVSAVGSQTSVRSFSACLKSGRSYNIHFVDTNLPDYGTSLADCGYTCSAVKLGYDKWHVLCVAKDDGFLPVLCVESLMRALLSHKYTTPVIPEWGKHLFDTMLTKRTLRECQSYNCKAGMLLASSEGIDQIVSDGLKSGRIRIPEAA